jgi:hypothetical protein
MNNQFPTRFAGQPKVGCVIGRQASLRRQVDDLQMIHG